MAEKRVLRFGNLEDLIFVRKAEIGLLQKRINNLFEEYDSEIEDEISVLETKQESIENEIRALESEMSFKSLNPA